MVTQAQRRELQSLERKARTKALYDEMMAERLTLEEVADRHGISRQRIQQRFKKDGLTGYSWIARKRDYQKFLVSCPLCGELYIKASHHLMTRFRAEGAHGYEIGDREHSRAAGHPLPGQYSLAQLDRDKTLADDYRAGLKLDEIRAKHNIDASSIYRAIRRQGVPRRWLNMGRRAYITEPDIQNMIKLRAEQGMTAADIGRRYDVSGGRIIQILQKRNVWKTPTQST